MIALSFLGYLLGTVACYRAIADTYLGRETSARASLRFAGGRLGATLWLTIVLVVGLVRASSRSSCRASGCTSRGRSPTR